MGPPQSQYPRTFGPFSIDAEAGKLLRDEKVTTLVPKAVAVLVALYDHPGELVSYDDLRKIVWRDETFKTDTKDHTIQQTVGAIRRAIRDTERRVIRNEPGFGYRFYGDVLPVTERQGHGILSPQEQEREHNSVIAASRPGFNLIVDGMIINSVGELLTDDPETRPIRQQCHASYARSLEDFAFALVYGSRIVTSKDFRPSVTTRDQPGKEIADRLGEICEQGTYPAEIAGGRLLYDEEAREKIRADIQQLAHCIVNRRSSGFFRDYMVREATKHLGTDSRLFQEDFDPEKYTFRVVRPYYQHRVLQAALGPSATDALIRFLPKRPSPNSKDRYAKNALREFATRNVLSLITIMWESDVFAEKTHSWRLPHILRALVKQQSLYSDQTAEQEALRDIVVQHALITALKNIRDTRTEGIVPALLFLRGEHPFEEIREVLAQEHLVFLKPDPQNEKRALEIRRLINSHTINSQPLDRDRFSLAQRFALRRLRPVHARHYEPELYRVFPALRPPGSQMISAA